MSATTMDKLRQMGFDERTAFHDAVVMSSIAHQIRDLRVAASLTQEQLASAMKTHRSVIANWESGEHNFTVNTLLRVASYFDVALIVRFTSWPNWILIMSPDGPLAVPRSFTTDQLQRQ